MMEDTLSFFGPQRQLASVLQGKLYRHFLFHQLLSALEAAQVSQQFKVHLWEQLREQFHIY